jgi:hypothetical protein
MKRLRKIHILLLFSIILLSRDSVLAQIGAFNRAQKLYSEKNAEAAKPIIDSAVLNSETGKMFEVHTLKAYIYFEIYKKTDKEKLNSTTRDSVISARMVSNSLKPDSAYKTNNTKLINAIIAHYRNMSIKALNESSLNYTLSISAHDKFKELSKNNVPNFNGTYADIEFYNTVGGIYSELSNKSSKFEKEREIAKTALLKVLDLDPKNESATFNLGILYYNLSGNIVKEMADDLNIGNIDAVQDNSKKLAKQAEQLLLKVANSTKYKKTVTEALYYTYRNLLDAAKLEEYRKKCVEQNIKLD